MAKIRVLVIDDSAFMRKMISQMLARDEEIEVVGTAMDGLFALRKIKNLKPDVLTLDINMPRMDGIETLRHIVEDYGIPTIIVSSFTKRNAELTFMALELGAFDFITKPQNALTSNITSICGDLIKLVKAAHRAHRAGGNLKCMDRVASTVSKEDSTGLDTARSLLAIGASTGGPNVLSYLLPRLPGDFPAGIMVVQHMPEDFTAMFAERLNSICEIEVKEAREGDPVLPGRALISPGNRHLMVKRNSYGYVAILSDAPKVSGHRPSVDVLFSSVAAEFGRNAAGLILTGMGVDGAAGMGKIRREGGVTIAQSEDSCVVFGMPKAAIEKGYISHVLSPDGIKDFLVDIFMKKEERNEAAGC